MLNTGSLIIREYQMNVIPSWAYNDLLVLFEASIRFETTVAKIEVPENPGDMLAVMLDILAAVERCVLVYVGEQRAAFMLIDVGAPYTIAALFVAEKYRGLGIGEYLINALQSRYPTASLGVDCYAGNERALKFYHRLGFSFCQGPLIMKGTRPPV